MYLVWLKVTAFEYPVKVFNDLYLVWHKAIDVSSLVDFTAVSLYGRSPNPGSIARKEKELGKEKEMKNDDSEGK